MRASDRVTGVGIRFPLCTCTLKAARRGRRPRRPASQGLTTLSAPFPCHSEPVRTGVGIRFPLPPSAREVAARSADGGSDIARQFLSPSRPRRQPPPSGGLAARRCRADGTSYPKGICSAALHGRTPSPTGGSTHLTRRAARPQAAVYPQAFSSTVQWSKSSLPLCSAPTCPFVGNRHRPTPLICHGMVPQASRTALFRHNKTPRLSSRGFVLALPIFPGRLQPSIVSRSEFN